MELQDEVVPLVNANKFDMTQRYPVLESIIQEAMRLIPPVSRGGERVTPPGGFTIASRWVPGGVVVRVPCYTISRDARYFERPSEFIPHRWTTKGYMVKDSAAYFPFSIGTYDCVGKQLALMEVREAVARLVTSFDMELADPKDVNWEHSGIDTFTLALPPLMINFRAR
ncbi:MAG: hypothetical protein M1839_008561 [Geoglossum umbratile]|nr:MAG: hypothetical protein M1839_008561 [Geoglossum umbratile]